MRIGLDNITRQRIQPTKGATAICQCCDLDLIAKCGKIMIHHWAHKSGNKCDHWWESETEWHRNWKDEFPLDWQEVIKFDHENKEKHIADIFNPSKELVIEFQHSPIDIDELKSRERFYKKMIWVINAKDFNIETSPLQLAKKDIEEMEVKYTGGRINSFFRIPHKIKEKLIRRKDEMLKNMQLSEWHISNLIDLFDQEVDLLIDQHEGGDPKARGIDPNQLKKELLQSICSKIQEEIDRLLKIDDDHDGVNKYYRYNWSRKRKVWNHADQPIFLDRGEHLFWLKSDRVLKKIPRQEFIQYYNG